MGACAAIGAPGTAGRRAICTALVGLVRIWHFMLCMPMRRGVRCRLMLLHGSLVPGVLRWAGALCAVGRPAVHCLNSLFFNVRGACAGCLQLSTSCRPADFLGVRFLCALRQK